jgi:hypothetical protein
LETRDSVPSRVWRNGRSKIRAVGLTTQIGTRGFIVTFRGGGRATWRRRRRGVAPMQAGGTRGGRGEHRDCGREQMVNSAQGGTHQRTERNRLKLWQIGLAGVVGLILGLVVLYDGVTYLCASMAPTSAIACPNHYPDSLVAAGISLIIISLIVLAYSFLRSRTAQRGTER